MASSRGIVVVLAINVCASSITGDLVLSVSLMWLASLLGDPRVLGALATCRVTLLEGPPTDAWFPGPACATASRRPHSVFGKNRNLPLLLLSPLPLS